MKRAINADEDPAAGDGKMKKRKGGGEPGNQETGFADLDEDLLFEVLKHVDARSLAIAACVSKQWHKTAQDERLWEMICTRYWANITGCGSQQLRSVVLALGGFRRLHFHSIWPFEKPSSSSSPSPSSSSSPSPFPPPVPPSKTSIRWGKDEVQLSLSLHSIRYFEMMNLNNRGR